MKLYRYVSSDRELFAFLRPIVYIEKDMGNGRIKVVNLQTKKTFECHKNRIFHIPTDLELLERYLNRHQITPRALCRDMFTDFYTLSWKGMTYEGTRLEIIAQLRSYLRDLRLGQGRLDLKWETKNGNS